MSGAPREHCWEAVLDGADITPAMARHWAGCPTCAARLRGLEEGVALLRRAVPPPSACMDARVLARARRRRPPAGRLVAGLAVAAATCAAVLLARPAPVSHEARAVPIVHLTADCGKGATRVPDDGRHLLVAGVWAAGEARRFARVLERFEHRTGVQVTYAYETRNIAAALKARLRRGCAPDVALIPQPGLVADLARRGQVHPLDPLTRALARRNYGASWRQLATVGGQPYGVWFKAAHKSMVWYRPELLRRAGITTAPRTWGDLLEAARRVADSGIRPFAISGLSPWTLTDWFENILLRSAGPRPYALLAEHRIPWTDPSVTQALRRLATLFGDPRLAGPTQAMLDTTFEESVADVFGRRPSAAMLTEGDFVRNFLPASARAGGRGVDARFFAFPAVKADSPSAAVVGGDMAVRFGRGPAATRLMRFLATPAAAAPWARAGGFLSPNRALDPDVYPDALTRRAAIALARTAMVRFDLSDLQPPAFGATAEQGMWSIFQDFLAGPRDPEATARRLERAARAAWDCQRAIRGRC